MYIYVCKYTRDARRKKKERERRMFSCQRLKDSTTAWHEDEKRKQNANYQTLACPSSGQGRLTARRPSARVSPSRARATDQSQPRYPHRANVDSVYVWWGEWHLVDSCPLPGHDTPGHPVRQRGEAGVDYSLAAFSIREARGWKFELVADCTSIDPARRDYFFPLCGCVCFYPARTDREEEHFRAGHPTIAFGSDGPTPLRYGFFSRVDDSRELVLALSARRLPEIWKWKLRAYLDLSQSQCVLNLTCMYYVCIIERIKSRFPQFKWEKIKAAKKKLCYNIDFIVIVIVIKRILRWKLGDLERGKSTIRKSERYDAGNT